MGRLHLNKVLNINKGDLYPDLKDYAVFTDNWICEIHKGLINERTGEPHEILDIKYLGQYEWDDPRLISVGGAVHREVKRTAVKTATPLNVNDFYIARERL